MWGAFPYLLSALQKPFPLRNSVQALAGEAAAVLQLHLTCRSSCPLSVMERGASNSFSSVSVSRATWVLVTAPARGSRKTYFLYLQVEDESFSEAESQPGEAA